MIKRVYRKIIKFLVRRGYNNAYIMIHIVGLGYQGDLFVLNNIINEYRKDT